MGRPLTPQSINYLGNKRRVASKIVELVQPYARYPGYVVDPFAGTGSVARAFAEKRPVITSDVQEYSRCLCATILNAGCDEFDVALGLANSHERKHLEFELTSRYSREIEEEDRILNATIGGVRETQELRRSLSLDLFDMTDGTYPLIRNYGCIYFTIRNSCVLQSYYSLRENANGLTRDVFSTMLIMLASKLVVTVGGHFAQPMKISAPDGSAKGYAAAKISSSNTINSANFISKAIHSIRTNFQFRGENLCFSGPDTQTIQKFRDRASVIYLDPPYGREHYSRFYHVLEDICIGSFSNDRISQTRMRPERFRSEYGLRTKAVNAFEAAIAAASDSEAILALSYVNESEGRSVENRIVQYKELSEIVDDYYHRSIAYTINENNYSQFNRLSGPEERAGREMLIIGLKS